MSGRHATLYDFRDLDLMLRLKDAVNGSKSGIPSSELASMLGFDDDVRPVSIRLAWMRRFGMVAFDDRDKLWTLSRGGERVVSAHVRAPALRAVEAMPDEAAVELMAHVTSRFQRGDAMLAQMLRREFLFGTQKR